MTKKTMTLTVGAVLAAASAHVRNDHEAETIITEFMTSNWTEKYPSLDIEVEQDVTDDLPILVSDERHPDITAVPKRIDEPSFIILVEGEAVDVPDGFVVGGGFWSEVQVHARLHTVRLQPPAHRPGVALVEECRLGLGGGQPGQVMFALPCGPAGRSRAWPAFEA